MATNAVLAGKLLRNAAKFFRDIGGGTPQIADQMEQNARTYEIVADWVETDPTAESPVAGDGD